jgi:hypothetical protein
VSEVWVNENGPFVLKDAHDQAQRNLIAALRALRRADEALAVAKEMVHGADKTLTVLDDLMKQANK